MRCCWPAARAARPRAGQALLAGRSAAALVDYACDRKLALGPAVEDLQELATATVLRGAAAKRSRARALLRSGPPDVERAAFGLLESAAEDGMPEAAHDLGLLLYSGRGCDGGAADKARAAELFEFAAREGVGKAAHNIGLMLHRGEGVQQDKARAVEFFELAAGQGFAKSAIYLGVMFETGDGVRSDMTRARQLYAMAEAAGAAEAGGARKARE